VPDGKWVHNPSKMKLHTGGTIYLNTEGIIERVEDHKTALSAMDRSFICVTYYVYDRKYNEILPYKSFIESYRFDENMQVTQTRNARLEIYSKLAVEAGKFNDK
jgi:hypothetical protein